MISTPPQLTSQHRLHLMIQGMVQGVGFRPFVYRLATELELSGWVCNSDRGVEIEVEGNPVKLAIFMERLEGDRPPYSSFIQLQTRTLPPYGYKCFEIHHSQFHQSQNFHPKSAWILPDLATCSDCLIDLFDPQNRRYQYPFTNCTHCGPRYSILTALPYDRPNTTMGKFNLCPTCQKEYNEPINRRFHAQPNACPTCGPQLELWDAKGHHLQADSTATLMQQVGDRIRQGQIVALKGLGGFHLMVDARNPEAVQRLRDRKHRPTKPFAVMYPSLEAVQRDCQVSILEAELLTSAAAPIVLLTPRLDSKIPWASTVAPHQSTIGVMLPYTPLHHLLLAELDCPIVATSGNRAQAPICIDNAEAMQELEAIADVFLLHNRPIVRPVDDSVVRVIHHRPMFLRRARGYAPFPIPDGQAAPLPCILALGGQLKNTIALSVQGRIVLSQYLGDLNDVKTANRFQTTIAQLLNLYAAQPIAIACDQHPDYASTQVAQVLSQRMQIPLLPIQHHHAHVLAGMVEHALDPPVLGIAWDGTGHGADRTSWGGEFLVINSRQPDFERVAHFRPFPLPGGDRAAREPRRVALGLLYAVLGEALFDDLDQAAPVLKNAFQFQELKLIKMMLKQGINSPLTSSVGRLFDGIAALLNLCQYSSFEGEAAMQLEKIATDINTTEFYPYQAMHQNNVLVLDWEPMLTAILADYRQPLGVVSAKFHNTLVEMIVAIAQHLDISQIVLTGGCFQNRYLLARSIKRLRSAGFQPHWHQQIPSNDGGLAVGQILGAAWKLDGGGVACV